MSLSKWADVLTVVSFVFAILIWDPFRKFLEQLTPVRNWVLLLCSLFILRVSLNRVRRIRFKIPTAAWEKEDTQSAAESDIESVLGEVFGSEIERCAAVVNTYKELYRLAEVRHEWHVEPAFFRHCQQRLNFVLVALYNENKEFFLIRSQTQIVPGEPLGWKLLGGPVDSSRREYLEEAAHRIVKMETNFFIDELTPVAFVENRFNLGAETVRHSGIAFLGRASGPVRVRSDLETMFNGTGLKPVSAGSRTAPIESGFSAEIPKEMAFSNREVLLIAKEKVATKYLALPIDEIRTSRNPYVRGARRLHRVVFSTIIYQFASRPLKERILSLIEQPAAVLDASAGDDLLIGEVAEKYSPPICVANDIGWLEMSRTREFARTRNLKILFTNHNVADLPFSFRFDIVILKNTLHHAQTPEEVRLILGGLRRIAKTLIVVDIEDPKKSRRARIFNRCYTTFQADQGHFFYSGEQFKRLLAAAYPDLQREHGAVSTIRGRYMISVIHCA